MKNYNAIDLFSGAGGLSYGFECAGFNILLGIDNDEKALETFEKNHNNAKSICGDITCITYENDIKPLIGNQKIDVIIGGPPCQGMSLSGPRKFDDPRNKLYLSYIRLVDEIRPDAFVIENVPGLVGLFGGQIKDNIIEKFTELGYSIQYKILCAADYGVPQIRKRLVFVGLLNSERDFDFPKPILDEEHYVTCEQAISDLPSLEKELGEEVSSYSKAPITDYQKLMRGKNNILHNHVAIAHKDFVKEVISKVPDGGNYKDLPKGVGTSRNFHMAWTRYRSDKPSRTIDTGHRNNFHYKWNRCPTVRESARLQSFPDDFVFYGNKTQQNRQVGNAVPVLMAKAVGAQIKKYLDADK